MKRFPVVFAWIALVLSTAVGFAGEMPEEPGMGLTTSSSAPAVQKEPTFLHSITVAEYSLWGSLVASHAADWMTTEKCLHTSQERESAGFVGTCHEAFLPNALVENKVGFGFYEAATAAAEIRAQYLLKKHHHGRIAFLAQVANVAGTAYVVAHNYRAVDAAAHSY
jgi:hypothetical protein